jgi:hypothetical protein
MKHRSLALTVALCSLVVGIATSASAAHNRLSSSEKKAGWRLLFDGKTLEGWHNFKAQGVKPGWQVKNGTLACVDPHNAGDIVTADKFEAFELRLDYNISVGGNSGIMFHVTEEGDTAWQTGPEIQLQDNIGGKDGQKAGWLYALYQPANDPKTGKPIDATKPPGKWNHLRIVISPDGSFHEMNGVRYVSYVVGSDDFKARVAKSKFGTMPKFAKASSGWLALQGDHGEVSFRNIKIRPLPVRK